MKKSRIFQFLIGRIKTDTEMDTAGRLDIFQFLIGRIKTGTTHIKVVVIGG